MNNSKQKIRKDFREAVFKRDGYRCCFCGKPGFDRQGGDLHLKYHKDRNPVALDSHHIVERSLMENGGYVAENGITVCDECHLKCEEYWMTGVALEGFSIEDLFVKINSNEEKARAAAIRLGNSSS